MKKIAIFVLVAILFIQVFSPMAFAATTSNSYISAFGANITNSSNGNIRINFDVTGTAYMNSLGASSIELYEDGSLIRFFSSSNPVYAPYMVASNEIWFWSTLSYPAKSGSTYYAVVSFFATNSTGTGTEVCMTNSITIP